MSNLNSYDPFVYLRKLDKGSDDYNTFCEAVTPQKNRNRFIKFLDLIYRDGGVPASSERAFNDIFKKALLKPQCKEIADKLIEAVDIEKTESITKQVTSEAPQAASGATGSNSEANTAKLETTAPETTENPSVVQMKAVEGQKNSSKEVQNIAQLSSSWTMDFPGRSEPVVFHYAEFKGQDEIEANTEVLEGDNTRNQKHIFTRVADIEYYMSKMGQVMPAFGRKPKGSSKISVLDGSCRRRGAINLGNITYRIFYTLTELTSSEIALLKNVFNTQREHSPYEVSRNFFNSFAEAYEEAKEKSTDDKKIKLTLEQYASETNTPFGTASEMIRVGSINPKVAEAFPNINKLSMNFLNKSLYSLYEELEKEEKLDELYTQLDIASRPYDGEEDHLIPDDAHTIIFNKLVKHFAPKKAKRIQENNTDFLFGVARGKNYVSTQTKNGVTTIKSKVDESVQKEIDEAIKAVLEKNNLLN